MASKVALIGYSYRFPHTDKSRFWNDLLAGRDLVTQVDPGRWAHETYCHPDKAHPGTSYTFAAGSLGDVSLFDAGFFNISPREAVHMDPQQRLLLEMAWETFEHAGVKPSSMRGSTCGVFIGISAVDHASRYADDPGAIESTTATGNTSSLAANRLSYFFDLHGPSMAIDTACSSSLVAFHQACRAIQSGETDQALTGGISLHLHPFGFITFSKASMLSRRGRCNAFDAAGDGYVRSEGGGLFLLKNYDQALADGDRILAVVVSSVVNTDGHKSGMTVPSADRQAALLHSAYATAGVAPDEIDYIEAHGTGTAVGDPIETHALGISLGQRRSQGNPLPIGSVKSNLGHLEPAAGVAGLVKSLLCIEHRMIPATAGVTALNPAIPFNDLNLAVVTENRPLKRQGKLVIGINSFGFGGANAHVVLESPDMACDQPGPAPRDVPLPLLISAKDESALQASARDLATHIQANPQFDAYAIAYHTVFRRDWLKHRAVVFGTNVAEFVQALQHFADGLQSPASIAANLALETAAGPAFIYSGNGAQWFGMGKGLLNDPLFKKTIQEVDVLFGNYADWSIEAELSGEIGGDRYELTEIAQPTLFAIQVGMTRMLEQLGVCPTAVAGHSVGEIAAAWACGALTLEAAVQVIYHRSQLQGTTKGLGQMTAVGLGPQAAVAILDELGLTWVLSLAGCNSPKGVTIAGPVKELERLEATLTERAVFNRRLGLDYAFHSPAMDTLEAGLLQTLADIPPGPARIPFYSTVSGGRLDGEALGAEYWWHNIRKPVEFERAIRQIVADGMTVFIEIGPHAILRTYINECLRAAEVTGRVISTGERGNNDPQLLRSAAGQAMIAGVAIDWAGLFPRPAAFIELPHYPWQRERHWHPITSETYGLLYRHKLHPLLGYPLPQQELAWENQFDTLTLPSLADHVVDDATVFPGAGFTEMALAAAHLSQAGDCCEIEELEIRAPLLLSDKRSKLVRLAIDASDGRFAINSRDVASTDAWNLNVTGRILREVRVEGLPRERICLPDRQPDFTAQDHYQLTTAVGLGYGPDYQTIEHGWVDGCSATAILRISPSLAAEIARYHLHPALLDGTFQLVFQLLKEQLADNAESIFVPIRIGRIILRGGCGAPHSARATVLRRSPHSVSAEFALFDASGTEIAVLKQTRFKALRVKRNSDHKQPDFLSYHAIPQPHALTAHRAAIPYSQLRENLHRAVTETPDATSGRLYAEDVESLLGSLCSQFFREALRGAVDHGQVIAGETIRDLKAAHPVFSALIDDLFRSARGDGIVEKTDVGYQLIDGQDEAFSAQDIWISLTSNYPQFFHIIHGVAKIGLLLKSILQGDMPPASLESRNSLTQLMRQVLGDDGKAKIDLAVRRTLSAAMEQLQEGRRLRVVEVSDGLPAFAVTAEPVLDATRSDYLFITPNPDTLAESRNLLESFPFLEVRLFDAKAPVAAPETEGRHDLAVVTCDFDTLETAVAALRLAGKQLADDGLLLFIGQHPARWVDFALGIQPGWWSVTPEGEVVSRQQPVNYWQNLLEKSGFASIEQLDLLPGSPAGPYLLLARRAASGIAAEATVPTTGQGTWVIVADARGYSAELASQLSGRLEAREAAAIRLTPGDSADITAELLQQIHGLEQLAGIVHLAGLHAVQAGISPAAYLDSQVDRCALARDIIKACEAAEATCWLVSAGAASHLLPGYGADAGDADLAAIADAALWGFGRTLMNEVDEKFLRMIDLEPVTDVETAATALVKELLQPDDEQETIITSTGERFVPRLGKVLAPGEPLEGSGEPENDGIRLGFQTPGQLRNLRWETQPSHLPAADEVEIDVRATGLNFRDFMYTLGLLSDEAVENGFVGPSLGLEFAGVVVRTGPEAKGFSAGDPVMGFAPASFGNRLITKAGAIAPMPQGFSFAAAATIPTAFFTVYYALHHLARLAKGEKVLIHGAAGGVGIAAIQVARWCGAEIYATAGSDEKRDFLRLLGIEHIFDSRSLDFAEEILAQTGGEGVDVVLNSLSGEAINRNLRILRPFGRFLELGKRDFYENTRLGLRPFRNNISYFGVDVDQLMKERPELTTRLFQEILELFRQGILHPLPYTTFEANDIVAAFRYMQQSRQIGKIIVTYQNGIARSHRIKRPARSNFTLPADATFLVVGGLNGFGLRTAEWLVEKGSRNLVLISRGGPSSETAREAVSRLVLAGVKVHAAACDVTDRHALASLLVEISHILPPLKGIIHSAMVIEDGLIRNQSNGQIHRVMAPKVLGALHLHELTRQMPLDYFIIFSSATTLFGNPGQGNYIAANSWLEALASYRQAKGQPVTCIALGAIDDAGYLARNTVIKEALQFLMGGSALTADTALAALESMLSHGSSGLGIQELDWNSLSRFLPRAGTPKFRELARLAVDSGDQLDEQTDLFAMAAELPDEELLATVIGLLKEIVGEVLRIAPEKIDEERPLYDLGLDSLMGVELAIAIESRFGIKLPAMVLSENPTIRKLALYFITQLRASMSGPLPEDEPRSPEQKPPATRQGTADFVKGSSQDINI